MEEGEEKEEDPFDPKKVKEAFRNHIGDAEFRRNIRKTAERKSRPER